MNNLNSIHLEQTFAVTPQVIWEHLTQLHYLQQWFFKELEDFSPRVALVLYLPSTTMGKHSPTVGK